MRGTFLAVLLAASPAALTAQAVAAPRAALPHDIRREVVERWNAPDTLALRSSERVQIDEGREVGGDVLVRSGPLTIGGHVRGNVLAVNSDVLLRPTARIDGDILVVGGSLAGRNVARVGGSTRIYHQGFQFREDGERILDVEDDSDADDTWWRRLERHRDGDWAEALRAVQAGAYNRVEGLPIELGPVVHRQNSWGSVDLAASAVVRTGSSFTPERDIGHAIRGEVRIGSTRAAGIGARIFNVVDPVQQWQLSDLEAALSAFGWRRDYRDHYQRHGANGYVTLYGARDLSVSATFGQERWSSREHHNPITILEGGKAWRPNPVMDEGLFHIGSVAVGFDTRTDRDAPWSGWFLNADIERGRGTVTQVAPASVRRSLMAGDGVSYTRGFFDFRRYNRLGGASQLNMRVVLGGWLGGDALPLERRLSVEGPGELAGFDFRSLRAQPNVGTCNGPVPVPGRPAECQRIALTQVEYRGDLRLDLLSGWDGWPRHYRNSHGDAVWVLFADAGRGWDVGTADRTMTYAATEFPSFSTFRTDVGVGIDVGGIGVYAAKSVSSPSESLNFILRLRHRF